MKNKLVKTALVILAPILVIGIANSAQSEKKSAYPQINVLNDVHGDMPTDVKAVRMIDRAGDHQSCFLNSIYSRQGKQTSSEWACWSDKVRK
jgi:hypothetical protein